MIIDGTDTLMLRRYFAIRFDFSLYAIYRLLLPLCRAAPLLYAVFLL